MSKCCTFDASPPPLKSSAVALSKKSKAVLGCGGAAFNQDVCTTVLKGKYGACPAYSGLFGQRMTSAASYACGCSATTPFCAPPPLKLSAQPRTYSDAGMLFNQWLGKHHRFSASLSREKTSADLQGRFENFVNTLRSINANNAGGRSTAVFGLNHLADRSPEQMRRRLGYVKDPKAHLLADFRLTAAAKPPPPPPAWFDWSLHGVVGETVDQGDCGSCFIFCTVAAMEAAFARKTGKFVKFSEQAIVNAYAGMSQENSMLCDFGGDPSVVLSSFRGYYMPAEAEAYVAGTCDILVDYIVCPNVNPKNPIETAYPWIKTGLTKTVTFASYKKTNAEVELEIMNFLVNNGPLIACVESTTWPKEYMSGVLQNFEFNQNWLVGLKSYEGGLKDWAQFTSQVIATPNHAVLLIGYGTTPEGVDYWIIRNSWGTKWGMQGAVWIPRVGKLPSSENRFPTGPFCMYSDQFVIPV